MKRLSYDNNNKQYFEIVEEPSFSLLSSPTYDPFGKGMIVSSRLALTINLLCQDLVLGAEVRALVDGLYHPATTKRGTCIWHKKYFP